MEEEGLGLNRETGKLETEGRHGRRGAHVSRTAFASIDLHSIPRIKARKRERERRRRVKGGFTWVQKEGADDSHGRN